MSLLPRSLICERCAFPLLFASFKDGHTLMACSRCRGVFLAASTLATAREQERAPVYLYLARLPIPPSPAFPSNPPEVENAVKERGEDKK